MEKVKEIELLQSLKGDTYFAEFFGDKYIDTMCENIRNDYPIEFDLDLLQSSPIVKENTELKNRIAQLRQNNETIAKDILVKANEYHDDTLEDLAERLIGHRKCLIIKLNSALPLSEEDRDTLAKLLTE